jgi:hypothetical protein
LIKTVNSRLSTHELKEIRVSTGLNIR